MSSSFSTKNTINVCKTLECASQLPDSPPQYEPPNIDFKSLFQRMKCLFSGKNNLNKRCESIRVAYFTKNRGPLITSVHSRLSQNKTCVLFNSSFNKDDYCYFYVDLFKNRYISKGVQLGSHITFGPDNGGYKVHNTNYILDNGRVMKKLSVCWYDVDSASSEALRQRGSCRNMYLEVGWNYIVGFCNEFFFKKGGTPPGTQKNKIQAQQQTPATIARPAPGPSPSPPETPTRSSSPQQQPKQQSSANPQLTQQEKKDIDFDMEVIKAEDKSLLFKAPQIQRQDPFITFINRYKTNIPDEKSEQIYMAWYSDTHYIVIGNAISEDEIKFEGQASTSSAVRNLLGRFNAASKQPSQL